MKRRSVFPVVIAAADSVNGARWRVLASIVLPRSATLSFIVALALAQTGCAPQGTQIKDVTQSETVMLRKRPGQAAITSLSISGGGEIAGTAEVQLILNDAVYKSERLAGVVEFRWSGDWYADQAEVRYIAGKVSGGRLTLRYEFRD
jgi:hypothetical protein